MEVNEALAALGRLSLEQIDEAIDAHMRQVDCLRRLRDIVEIREEAKAAGDDPDVRPVIQAAEPKKSRVRTTQRWPKEGTIAIRVCSLLTTGRATVQQIAERLVVPISSVYSAVSTWRRNGVLGYDAKTGEVCLLKGAEEPRGDGSDGSERLVRRYLEFNQPAKVSTISKDTGVPANQILSLVTDAGPLKHTERGLVLR